MIFSPLTVTLTLLMTSSAEEVEVMSGILTELLTLPTIYDTFVPIILEYKLPTYSKENMSTLSWMNHEQCSSPEYKAKNSICPIAFYLPTEVNNFLSFLDEMNPRDSQKDSQISNEILGEEDLEVDTNHNKIMAPTMNWKNLEESIKIFQHTRTLTKDVAEEYLTSTIKNPAVTVYYMSRNIEYFRTGQDNKINNIRNMLNSFRTAYWQNINSDRIDEALLANVMSSYQSMVFQQYLMESFRWSRAELECRLENIIPKTIVSKGKVANALRNLAMQLNNHSYSLAISEDQIERYFSEKLASCVFTQDDSFIVTIQVPVHRHSLSENEKNHSLRLIKVHSVPFVPPSRPSQVCQVRTIKDSTPFYMQDMTTGVVRASSCKSRELCGVSHSEQPSESFLESSFSDPCITLVLSSLTSSSAGEGGLSKKSVEKYCPLTCTDVQDSSSVLTGEAPWMKIISSDTAVVLTGQSLHNNNNHSKSAILRCPEEKDRLIPTFSVGAALVHVPNRCKIVFLQEKDPKLTPYRQTHQVIPIHWIENGVLGQYSVNSLKITGSSETVHISDDNNDGSTSHVTSKKDNCNIECTHQIGTSHFGIVISGIFVLATVLITCFVYLFLEIRKLKGQLGYEADEYKEFVAYKNGAVSCKLLEPY